MEVRGGCSRTTSAAHDCPSRSGLPLTWHTARHQGGCGGRQSVATSNEAMAAACRPQDDDGGAHSQTGAPGRGAGGADRGDPVFPAHIAGVTPQTTAVANVAGIDSGVHCVDTGGISDHVGARRHLLGPSLAWCPRHIALRRLVRPGQWKIRAPIMGGLRPRCPRPRPIRLGSVPVNDRCEFAPRRRALNRLGIACPIAVARDLGHCATRQPLASDGKIVRFAALGEVPIACRTGPRVRLRAHWPASL